MRFKLLLILLALTAAPAYAYDKVKLLQSFFSTVMIRGYNADGTLAYGTGVVIDSDKVLTNCHTFQQVNSKPWISQGEEIYYINGIKVDRAHDLCLLLTDKLPIKPTSISRSADLKKGQPLVSIGHSSGMPAPVTSIGVVKSLYPMDGAWIIRTNARFALGASGSGLFDEEGRLVGINTFKTVGRSAHFYAMPIEWLSHFDSQPTITAFPITGKAFWEETEHNVPYFMQTVGPEFQEDWPKLQAVANNWINNEPNSNDAWFTLGLAHEGQQHYADAESAYKKSLALESSNPDALYRLGLLASKKGELKEVQAIIVALKAIDEEVADELSKQSRCSTEC